MGSWPQKDSWNLVLSSLMTGGAWRDHKSPPAAAEYSIVDVPESAPEQLDCYQAELIPRLAV